MRVRDELRGLAATMRRRAQGRDTALIAAGLTFYAGFAVVPVLVLSLGVTTWLTSGDTVRALGRDLAHLLPGQLGARGVVARLVEAGIGLDGWHAVLTFVPISLYGEGLRRALLRYTPAVDRYTAWRGRLLALPLLLVAPLLVYVLLQAARAASALHRGGSAADVAGFLVGYYAVLAVLLPPLLWGFGVVAAGALRRPALLAGAFLTAASLAGFLQGFAVFLGLPLDLGAPFGGLTVVGGVLAVAFWLWLLQLVLIGGWLLTEALDERLRRSRPVTSLGSPGLPGASGARRAG